MRIFEIGISSGGNGENDVRRNDVPFHLGNSNANVDKKGR